MSPPLTLENQEIKHHLERLRPDLSEREITIGLSAICHALRRFKLDQYRIKLSLHPFDFHNVPAGVFDLQVGFKPYLGAQSIMVYVRLKAFTKEPWT